MPIALKNQALIYTPGPGGQSDGYVKLGRVFNPPPGQTEPELMSQLAENPRLMAGLETDLSLAHYRAKDDKLVLIRDGCGLSPLFYAPKDGGWVVAFELGTLFEILGGPPPMDEETFFDFVATHYRYVFRDPGRTFHKGVRQVPPGTALTLSAGTQKLERWLNLSFWDEIPKLGPQAAAEKYVSLLDENVALRLKALEGERYAFTVSSGMDSSTVAALAYRHLGKPLECWFMAYKDLADSPYDESQGVNDLIKATGWKLNRVDLTAPDLLEETSALMELTKAPMITVTWLA
ncbi:MAG: hypothetical protein LBJ61_11130, partial [Deltaproteobacteria bacterium]|nr:hypothetical protein [Deltaproteobacteria bacterium]